MLLDTYGRFVLIILEVLQENGHIVYNGKVLVIQINNFTPILSL